jgi:prevent-host-death family protein
MSVPSAGTIPSLELPYCGYNPGMGTNDDATTATVSVGIRELRDHLSAYVAEAREGSEITVTDHGTPVAVLSGPRTRSRLDELVEAGVVSPAHSVKGAPLPAPVRAHGTVSDLIADQRR